MARPVRIEYSGAVYHVICRGNNRQAIFRDEQDRSQYLEKLSFIARTNPSIFFPIVYWATRLEMSNTGDIVVLGGQFNAVNHT